MKSSYWKHSNLKLNNQSKQYAENNIKQLQKLIIEWASCYKTSLLIFPSLPICSITISKKFMLVITIHYFTFPIMLNFVVKVNVCGLNRARMQKRCWRWVVHRISENNTGWCEMQWRKDARVTRGSLIGMRRLGMFTASFFSLQNYFSWDKRNAWRFQCSRTVGAGSSQWE